MTCAFLTACRVLVIVMPAYPGALAPVYEGSTMGDLGKILVGLGAFLLVVGLILWLTADKLQWVGRLPGDIRIERQGFQFYAPLMTCILLSVGLILALWLFNRF